MLAFQSARKALECAVDIRRAFADRNQSAEEPILVHFGLHTGEPLNEEDGFFGKNVILAARIAGQAQGGEILVSSLLKEFTESAGDIPFGEGREVELEGAGGPAPGTSDTVGIGGLSRTLRSLSVHSVSSR